MGKAVALLLTLTAQAYGGAGPEKGPHPEQTQEGYDLRNGKQI